MKNNLCNIDLNKKKKINQFLLLNSFEFSNKKLFKIYFANAAFDSLIASFNEDSASSVN